MVIPGKDGEFHFGTGGFSKSFPEVPMEFRVSYGKQESRLVTASRTRNAHGLTGTWDALEVSGS